MLRLAAVFAVVLTTLFIASTPASAAGERQVLGRTLPEMKFTGVAFGEAIEFLRDVSGANIHVNWKALEEAGVTQDTQVNISLRSVSMRKILDLLLSEASGGDTLTYYVDGGVIEITTKELADKKLITRIYPVDDLIMEIPDFTNAPDFSLQSVSDQGSQGGQGGGGGSGQGLFADTDTNRDDEETATTKEERGQQLVELIKELIRPEIWNDAGGPASIRYWNGNLIVTAPRSVHDAIGR